MDSCPKCGDTEYGFSHCRTERFTATGAWGEAPQHWDADGLERMDRYVTCDNCGHKVPWKTAYGETKEQPPQGGSSDGN